MFIFHLPDYFFLFRVCIDNKYMPALFEVTLETAEFSVWFLDAIKAATPGEKSKQNSGKEI